MNYLTLEFQKIFFGEHIILLSVLEIVFRTIFMYLYAVINVHLMDKRSMGQLSPFEVIIVIAMGTSVSDPMFYTHVPLFHGMVVISTIVFLERLLAKLAEKINILGKFLNGSPALLIKHGIIQEHELDKQDLSKDELFSLLRIKGIKNTGEVAYAYLEPSGSFSVITMEQKINGVSTIN